MSLRDELIQVAAVALAILQDDRCGSTKLDAVGYDEQENLLSDIVEERQRQEEKWGVQHHSPIQWLAILAEEVGEMASEVDYDPHDDTQVDLVRYLQSAEDRARRLLRGWFGA